MRARPADSRRRRRPRRVLAVAVLAGALAACQTGERPSFEDELETAPPTGNADIDAVLGLLDSVDSSVFTAEYDIETKFNTVMSTGLVVQASGDRRSITVDNDERSVRFISEGTDERTCNLLTSECETSLNDARISDTQLPHTFYGPAFAQRLRADANRRIGDPERSTQTIAGQDASCVDVAVAGGTKTYCALESGALARFVGADVEIELTGYSDEPDTSAFAT